MTTNDVPTETETPPAVRRLDSASSRTLADLVEMFDDLQMVLRCCERLVSELAVAGGDDDAAPDGVLVEAIWTLALLCYARCFSPRDRGTALTEEDVAATQPSADVLAWHQVLLELRDHHIDAAVNPRERFSVGVTQGESGTASGVAITSSRQPLVDDLTVRQTGAIAYALSALVNDRIETQQEKLFDELKNASQVDLEMLPVLDVAPPSGD